MSAEQLLMAWLSLPSWRWVCETRRCRQLLLEYIIKCRHMNARLMYLLSVSTELEGLSGQQLIDGALYIWRKKVHPEKYTSTQLSANVRTSAPVHNSTSKTCRIWIIGKDQAHGAGFPHDSIEPNYIQFCKRLPEFLQPLMRKWIYIVVNCLITRDKPEENVWNFVKDMASRMNKHQVLIINIVPRSASASNEAVIWRTVYEQVSKGPNTWLLELPIYWMINIK